MRGEYSFRLTRYRYVQLLQGSKLVTSASREHHFTRREDFAGVSISPATTAVPSILVCSQTLSPSHNKQHCRLWRLALLLEMPYDSNNGLVFNETVVSQHRQWCMQEVLLCPPQKIRLKYFGKESHSLYDMALRLLCRNAESLEVDLLKDLPDHILQRISRAVACS